LGELLGPERILDSVGPGAPKEKASSDLAIGQGQWVQ
jgi:hypothetical protein